MKHIVWALFLSILQSTLYAQDCHNLMSYFIQPKNNITKKQSIYNDEEIKEFKKFLNDLSMSTENKIRISNILEYQSTHKVEPKKVKLYIEYVNTLRGEKLEQAINDLKILKATNEETSSVSINEFEKLYSRLPNKYKFFQSNISFDDFSSLYFSCKSAIPNPKNNNAKKIYAKFSLALSTSTVATTYAINHSDDEKDFKWYSQMAYEVSFNAFTSYLGSKIQTNPNDTQMTKSLKNYLTSRMINISDVVLYPVLFPKNEDKINNRIKELENSKNFDEEIKKLHQFYEERGLYSKFKDEIVAKYKSLIEQKYPVNIGEIEWVGLTVEDLDRPEVQETLVLAAQAELYELNRGPWLDTGDVGLDRYAFSSLYSMALIPRNMAQSYLSYQILCMGQNNLPMAITKAAIFNTSINFFVSQGYYKFRKETINN